MPSSVVPRGVSVDLGEEELEMTFQIALVGSDGLVVGSDRKMVYRTQERNGAPYSQPSASDKFTQSADASIVCFFAGGPQAKSIADLIVTECKPDQHLAAWHNDLRKTAEMLPADSYGAEIIVIRAQRGDIALINKTGQIVGVSPVDGARCTGVTVKCRFFVEAFWEKTHVEGLRQLALIALQNAASERSESVGFGFNLMLLKDGNARWEEFSENDGRVLAICDQFRQQVRHSIFGFAEESGNARIP